MLKKFLNVRKNTQKVHIEVHKTDLVPSAITRLQERDVTRERHACMNSKEKQILKKPKYVTIVDYFMLLF